MGFEAMPLQANFLVERGFQVFALFGDHAMFYVTLRETSAAGDAFRKLPGFCFQLVGGDYTANDSQAEGVVRRKHLRGIEQFGGARRTDDSGKKIGAAEI